MARGRYRPSTSARRGGCAWQWLIIGLALGFGCAVTILLGGIALGQVTLDVGMQPTDTPVVVVITATPLPATPTLPPTNTPLPTSTLVTVEEIDTPTPTPAPPTATPTPEPGRGNPTVLAALEGQLTELMSVAGGNFIMGTTAQEVLAAVDACVAEGGNCQLSFGEDSSPPHSVTLNAFRMERSEVTYAQYLVFLNALGPRSHLNGCDGQACLATLNETDLSNVTFDSVNYRVPGVLSDRPVSGVTWYGARAYCEAIGRRLPSEAEWERAARSNDNRIFPWGNLRDVALAQHQQPGGPRARTTRRRPGCQLPRRRLGPARHGGQRRRMGRRLVFAFLLQARRWPVASIRPARPWAPKKSCVAAPGMRASSSPVRPTVRAWRRTSRPSTSVSVVRRMSPAPGLRPPRA